MTDIQINVIQTTLFHLEIDGARHNVTRRQLCTLIMPRHEPLTRGGACAGGQFQQCALATQCLADQERFRVGVIQASRMELNEFHIGNPAAGARCHGDTVAGG